MGGTDRGLSEGNGTFERGLIIAFEQIEGTDVEQVLMELEDVGG